MELRRLSLCLAIFILAVYTRCSDAHTMQKREGSFEDYSAMADEANEDAQNDDGGNEAEEESPEGRILIAGSHYKPRIGDTVQLPCKVDPFKGPVVEWSKNGNPIFMLGMRLGNFEVNRSSIVNGTHDLLISDLTPSDNGVYKCSVIQEKPVFIEHNLTVLESPRVLSFTANNGGVVMEGGSLELICNVSGNTAPKIIFSRNSEFGNAVMNDEGAVSGNVLRIDNIRPEQAGVYYCYVISTAGNAQGNCNVTVLHKPKVHVHKATINSVVGVEALLECAVHGNPPPSITWYKDGNVINPADSKYDISTSDLFSNLTVLPAEDQDFGTFSCEASNEHGTHRKAIELVQRPVIENLSVEGNKLAFRVHSHQPLEAIRLQLDDMQGQQVPELNIPIPTKNHHVYDVIYAVENMVGKYQATVRARNTKDWTSSDPQVITLDEQAMPIQTASVYHNNAHSTRLEQTVFASAIFMYLLVRML